MTFVVEINKLKRMGQQCKIKNTLRRHISLVDENEMKMWVLFVIVNENFFFIDCRFIGFSLERNADGKANNGIFKRSKKKRLFIRKMCHLFR